MKRRLYLIAYDITEAKRLNQVRKFLKGFSTGGQKSVFECFLTEGELNEVRSVLLGLIDAGEDRVHIFAMDGASRTYTLGIGVAPQDPAFFYFG